MGSHVVIVLSHHVLAAPQEVRALEVGDHRSTPTSALTESDA